MYADYFPSGLKKGILALNAHFKGQNMLVKINKSQSHKRRDNREI